jgi:hypothetical protein
VINNGERMQTMRTNGKKYAEECTWDNRAKEWAKLL